MDGLYQYTLRPDGVTAIQLTAENAEKVAIWCGGQVIRMEKSSDPKDVYIRVDVPSIEGMRPAEVRDYIVHNHSNGRFYPLSEPTFVRRYEREEESE